MHSILGSRQDEDLNNIYSPLTDMDYDTYIQCL